MYIRHKNTTVIFYMPNPIPRGRGVVLSKYFETTHETDEITKCQQVYCWHDHRGGQASGTGLCALQNQYRLQVKATLVCRLQPWWMRVCQIWAQGYDAS